MIARLIQSIPAARFTLDRRARVAGGSWIGTCSRSGGRRAANIEDHRRSCRGCPLRRRGLLCLPRGKSRILPQLCPVRFLEPVGTRRGRPCCRRSRGADGSGSPAGSFRGIGNRIHGNSFRASSRRSIALGASSTGDTMGRSERCHAPRTPVRAGSRRTDGVFGPHGQGVWLQLR